MAIIGERSSQAQPTPVARLVAPGPSVAMQRPGAPVMRPVTSAAKPAEPSCAVSTKSMPPLRIASISGSTLPLGMPKPRSMPAAFRVATIRSALFIDRPHRDVRRLRAGSTRRQLAIPVACALGYCSNMPRTAGCHKSRGGREVARAIQSIADGLDGGLSLACDQGGKHARQLSAPHFQETKEVTGGKAAQLPVIPRGWQARAGCRVAPRVLSGRGAAGRRAAPRRRHCRDSRRCARPPGRPRRARTSASR